MTKDEFISLITIIHGFQKEDSPTTTLVYRRGSITLYIRDHSVSIYKNANIQKRIENNFSAALDFIGNL